ncbi:MAG: serine/threonine protein kinase [Verrucomicrobiota bacterium]|nr:serine/threonine protein kinase [Verrucomicrobiota bacterium]
MHHPNIVTLHEFGEADGLFYFVMEFVDGVNLRQLLNSGRISPREALAIVPQICDALQFAHDRDVVHRDIKPENILLNKTGQVKIADFGVSKIVARELEEAGTTGTPSSASPLTQAGGVLGTPQYMAPEQMAQPLEVDHRADIYSLGVVFYQMLTGELPVGRFAPPSRKVQVDVRLDEVVLRALEQQPELRFQQASEVKTMVETIAQTQGKQSSPSNANATAPAGSKQAESSVGGRPGSATRSVLAAILGSFWILALVLLLGRRVARTEPTMYSFFGVGGWLWPSTYHTIVAVCVAAALVCFVVVLAGSSRFSLAAIIDAGWPRSSLPPDGSATCRRFGYRVPLQRSAPRFSAGWRSCKSAARLADSGAWGWQSSMPCSSRSWCWALRSCGFGGGSFTS